MKSTGKIDNLTYIETSDTELVSDSAKTSWSSSNDKETDFAVKGKKSTHRTQANTELLTWS